MNYRIFVNKKSSRPDRINYTNRIGKSSQTKISQILRNNSLKSYSPDRKILPNVALAGSRDCCLAGPVVSRDVQVRERSYQNPGNLINKLRNILNL